MRAGRGLLLSRPADRGPGPRIAALALAAAAAAAGPEASAAPALRVNGSTTVNPVVTEAADILRSERGLAITVDTLGGSSGGLAALGEGRAEIAMSSRPVTAEDRRRFPHVRFVETPIGLDGVALVVSEDVWAAGLRALSREQARRLYEGRVGSWREFGGPDRRVAFFAKEPGRGTWEVFAGWLYGDAARAPGMDHPEVGANEEARAKVASTPGAVSQLSVAWAARGSGVRPLALRLDDGSLATPDPASVRTGRYPMARRLLLVTDGAPAGAAAELAGFLLSPRGQALVEKHGYLSLAGAEGGR